MNSSELADKVNYSILEWAHGQDKLVVAIDGYTGVGKTSLVNALLALNPEILVVNRDDFLFSRDIVKEKLDKAEDKSTVFELEVCDDKKLADLVAVFRKSNEPYSVEVFDGVSGKVQESKTYDFSKKIMVVEGVFMFHPQLLLSTLWDKRIYLEGHPEKIRERRIKREQERWGDNYFPETHPDSNFRQVMTGLDRYKESYHPEKLADLVFNVD